MPYKDQAKKKAHNKEYYKEAKKKKDELPLSQELTKHKIEKEKELAKKEHSLAHLRELEVLEKEGKLVNLEKVKTTFRERGRIVRDSLLNIPARIAPILSSMTDHFEIEMLLKKEITDALWELSGREEVVLNE